MPPDTSSVWVPVCCGRVMRFNTFKNPDGSAYGALVCGFCSKNVILEQEPAANVATYGEGAAQIGLVGSPKPPKDDRRKARARSADPASDDRTL